MGAGSSPSYANRMPGVSTKIILRAADPQVCFPWWLLPGLTGLGDSLPGMVYLVLGHLQTTGTSLEYEGVGCGADQMNHTNIIY